jgi:hypothetical protein
MRDEMPSLAIDELGAQRPDVLWGQRLKLGSAPWPPHHTGSSQSQCDRAQVPWQKPAALAFVVPSAHKTSALSCEKTPVGLSQPGTTHA